MLSAFRSRALGRCRTVFQTIQLHRSLSSFAIVENTNPNVNNLKDNNNLLSLDEVERILSDVKADNVQVILVPKHYDFADYMVVATGRSAWHVRNIAQALIYKVKQKQRGVKRMVLPSVEGQETGKWIVIDSGPLIIHALDEKVRAYYNLERLWTGDTSNEEPSEDLEKAFVKVRRKNNSKKSPQKNA